MEYFAHKLANRLRLTSKVINEYHRKKFNLSNAESLLEDIIWAIFCI